MVFFEKGKVYKHKKSGVIREVDYIYEDSKNSRKCVVFKGNEGNYIDNVCNEYEYSTVQELKKYENKIKQESEKINNDRKLEINKNGLNIFNNNGKLVFSIK